MTLLQAALGVEDGRFYVYVPLPSIFFLGSLGSLTFRNFCGGGGHTMSPPRKIVYVLKNN